MPENGTTVASASALTATAHTTTAQGGTTITPAPPNGTDAVRAAGPRHQAAAERRDEHLR